MRHFIQPNRLLNRWATGLSHLTLGLCLTSPLLSSGFVQAQPATAPSQQTGEMAEPVSEAAAINISPSQRRLIEALLTLTNQESLFNQTMDLTIAQVSQNMPTLMESMIGESIEPSTLEASQANMERIMGKILEGFRSRISFQEIAEEVYYPLYAKNFSEAQLQDMIDFYQTPTGQHTIAVMPQLVQDSMGLTQEKVMPVMVEVLEEVMAEEMGSF